MNILIEAKGKVKFIEEKDFSKLRTALGEISSKYDIDVEVKNFKLKS